MIPIELSSVVSGQKLPTEPWPSANSRSRGCTHRSPRVAFVGPRVKPRSCPGTMDDDWCGMCRWPDAEVRFERQN